MDPLDFLRVARNLSGLGQEAEWRTSVGRSYYALFNNLRLKLEPIKPFPGDEEDHQRVVYYLMKANNRDLQSVGQWLKDLRNSRNDADYRMNVVVGQDQSRLAITRADKAIAKFTGVNAATLRVVIGAIATYRSRRESENR